MNCIKIRKSLRSFVSDIRFRPLRDLVLWVLLLIFTHYFYLWWSGINFYPIHRQMTNFFDWNAKILLRHSAWVVENLLPLNFYLEGNEIRVLTYRGDYGYVAVIPGCTSLKQWVHWLFIMLPFPGTWKHKLWYIPAGLLIIYLTNIVRISGLAFSLKYWPEHFDFFHDYVFKTMFYFIIFLISLVWMEYFRKPGIRIPGDDVADIVDCHSK
jgi:exosortase/archaeosortase family protein